MHYSGLPTSKRQQNPREQRGAETDQPAAVFYIVHSWESKRIEKRDLNCRRAVSTVRKNPLAAHLVELTVLGKRFSIANGVGSVGWSILPQLLQEGESPTQTQRRLPTPFAPSPSLSSRRATNNKAALALVSKSNFTSLGGLSFPTSRSGGSRDSRLKRQSDRHFNFVHPPPRSLPPPCRPFPECFPRVKKEVDSIKYDV